MEQRGNLSTATDFEGRIARTRKLQESLGPARIPSEDELRAEKRAEVQLAVDRLGDFATLREIAALANGETLRHIEKERGKLSVRVMVLREVRASDRKAAAARGVDAEVVAIERMQKSIEEDADFDERARRDERIEQVIAACIENVQQWAPDLYETRLAQLRAEWQFRRGAIVDGQTASGDGSRVRNATPAEFTPGQVIGAATIVPTDRCLSYIRAALRPDAPRRDPQVRRLPPGALMFDPGSGAGVFAVDSVEGVMP